MVEIDEFEEKMIDSLEKPQTPQEETVKAKTFEEYVESSTSDVEEQFDEVFEL